MCRCIANKPRKPITREATTAITEIRIVPLRFAPNDSVSTLVEEFMVPAFDVGESEGREEGDPVFIIGNFIGGYDGFETFTGMTVSTGDIELSLVGISEEVSLSEIN